MYEHNQTLVPDSFLALYVAQGRPTRDRAFVEARHEMCEDLAQQTSDFCQSLQFSKELTELATLEKCRLGLLASPTAVAESEADWVICRVAELLNWPLPDHIAHATR
jgi:hypothetical protein